MLYFLGNFSIECLWFITLQLLTEDHWLIQDKCRLQIYWESFGLYIRPVKLQLVNLFKLFKKKSWRMVKLVINLIRDVFPIFELLFRWSLLLCLAHSSSIVTEFINPAPGWQGAFFPTTKEHSDEWVPDEVSKMEEKGGPSPSRSWETNGALLSELGVTAAASWGGPLSLVGLSDVLLEDHCNGTKRDIIDEPDHRYHTQCCS